VAPPAPEVVEAPSVDEAPVVEVADLLDTATPEPAPALPSSEPVDPPAAPPSVDPPSITPQPPSVEVPTERVHEAAPPRAAAASVSPAQRNGAPAPPGPRPMNGMPGPALHAPQAEDGGFERAATAPQLRRFIKSRAYVPMHELRRRFAINGADDEVTAMDLERQRVFVGLPEREGRLLAELLRGGDIGYELSLDPVSPIVVGVYPMRPVTRA
jgi:hypothetical protein